MPTTSWPCSLSSAAVTDESTPPDMATTIRPLAPGAAMSGIHHIAGRGRQLHRQPVELFRHHDLTAETRGPGQPEGEVEHVFLIFAGGIEPLVPFRLEDDVTGRAGERALARALDIDAVLVRDLQNREAQRGIDLAARAIALDEDHFRHGRHINSRGRRRVPRPRSRRRARRRRGESLRARYPPPPPRAAPRHRPDRTR